MADGIVWPAPLCAGDRVAIVSPASKIDVSLIDSAADALRREGFVPVVMPHAGGERGSFSGSADERLADITDALKDDTVRALLCSRGGYGAVHLLPELDCLPENCFDKWLVGFSDITALHALWGKKGRVSLHGAMAKYIGRGAAEFEYYGVEMGILRGARPTMRFVGHPYNRSGMARGRIVGGNLAVLGGLIGTPFDPLGAGGILFMEDIAEPIYKVERILWQLRLCGLFDRVAGVIVGQFTEYRPSADHESMEAMIERFFRDYGFPVAYGVPMGHVDNNHPLIMNAEATLSVTSAGVEIVY